MTATEVGKFWNENAEAWTVLTRKGYDLYRDHLNTPAFLEMLPQVEGQNGLDIGCGEGHNTRLLAARGAKMTALDISEVFIQHAKAAEAEAPLGIAYQVASATELPFPDGSFDFAASFMCLMDIPEMPIALQEAYRVLKRGGFLQFSISHPCFSTAHRKNKRNWKGETYAIEVGDYFRNLNGELEEWIFGAAPSALRSQFPKFKVPRFNFTLSEWVNAILQAGFVLEAMQEPCPTEATLAKYPYLQDSQVVAYFLQVRCRKP